MHYDSPRKGLEGGKAEFSGKLCERSSRTDTTSVCHVQRSRRHLALSCTGYGTVDGVFMCAEYDLKAHPHAHFHKREYAINGCRRALEANLQYHAEKDEPWVPTRTYMRFT